MMQFEEGAPVWYSLKEGLKNTSKQTDAPAFVESVVVSVIDKNKSLIQLLDQSSPSILSLLNEKQSNQAKPSNLQIQQGGNQNLIVVDNIFLEPRYDKEDGDYSSINDLVNLPFLNEPELLKAIAQRYVQDKIFSYVGPTLVVVNPYKRMDHLFNEKTQELFQEKVIQNQDIYSELPHIFGIAAYCMQSILQEKTLKQAIVISGESGAGKTENTKYAMKFLTQMNASLQQQNTPQTLTNLRESYLNLKFRQTLKSTISIEQRILNCNPILEAFGNAKTTRNDNSSRFGKLVILHLKEDPSSFSIKQKQKKLVISSASLTNYLLEKSRIVQISPHERNYHIFYHLLKGADPQFLSQLGLSPDISSYRYLKSECSNVDTISDEELFLEVMSSLDDLNFTEIEQKGIWNIVSCVLLLGNLDFEDIKGTGDSCTISPKQKQIVETICKKLQCTEKDLNDALTTKKRQVNNNITTSPLSIKESTDNRDSYSKFLYEKLFNWIVFRLNQSIMDQDEADQNTLHVFSPQQKRQSITQGKKRQIEILDIFGFEVFENNSFEQLCINFANEKLQQLYISYIYEGEKNIFKQQGLEKYLMEIKYTDNKSIIEALDKPKDPIGVFNLIDDSSNLSTGSDLNLISQMEKEHKSNSQHVSFSQIQKTNFTIHHSTGSIEYNINNFRAKNKDEVSLVLQNLAQQKTIKSIIQLGIADLNTQQVGSRVTDKFLGSKFRLQMKKLMEELSSCECQFVRCIKPNGSKKAGLIQSRYSLNQINCLGVLETIRVRKQGYVYRAEYFRFYKDNWELYPPNFNEIKADVTTMFQKITDYYSLSKKLVEMNVDQKQLEQNNILFGSSMIFIKESALMILTSKLIQTKEEINRNVKVIQKLFRKYKLKKWLKNRKKVKQFLKGLIYKFRYLKSDLVSKIRGMRKAKEIEAKQNISSKKIQKMIRNFILKKRMKEIRAAMMIQRAYILYKRREYYKQKLKIIKEFIKSKFLMLKERSIYKKKLKSILQIQLWYKKSLRQRQIEMCKKVIMVISQSIDKSWFKIRDVSATKIQSLVRMYLTKVSNYGIVKQSREAKNIILERKAIQKIQRYWRYRNFYLSMKRYRNAAYRIQAYYRKKWCSALFQLIKKNTKFIQMHVRSWLNQKYFLTEKWVKYDWTSVKRDEMLNQQNLVILGIPYKKNMVKNLKFEELKNQFYEQHTVLSLQRAQKKIVYLQKNQKNLDRQDSLAKLAAFKQKIKSQKSIALSSAKVIQQQSIQEFDDLGLDQQLKVLKSTIRLGGLQKEEIELQSPVNKINEINIKLDDCLNGIDQNILIQKQFGTIQMQIALKDNVQNQAQIKEQTPKSQPKIQEYYYHDLGLEKDHILYDFNQESRKKQVQSQLQAKRMSVDVIKLNTILLDLDQQPQSHEIYTSQVWAQQYQDIQNELEQSNSTILKIFVGDSYTTIVGDNSVCYFFGDEFLNQQVQTTDQPIYNSPDKFQNNQSLYSNTNQSLNRLQQQTKNISNIYESPNPQRQIPSFKAPSIATPQKKLQNELIPSVLQNNPLFIQLDNQKYQNLHQSDSQKEFQNIYSPQKQYTNSQQKLKNPQNNSNNSLYNSLRKKAGLLQKQEVSDVNSNQDTQNNISHQSEENFNPSKNKKVIKCKVDKINSIFKANNQLFIQNQIKDLYCWGDNSQFEIPFFEEIYLYEISKMDSQKSKQISQIDQQVISNQFFYLLTDGDVLHYNHKISTDFERIRFPVQIFQISCGGRFTMFLSVQGTLFSSGQNTSGELGHGDRLFRKSPQLISSFKKFGEKIKQVSCGLKHTVCLSALGKVFSWGNNTFGQLGVGDTKYRAYPQLIFMKSKSIDSINSFLQVRVGLRSSIVLTIDKRIAWWGTNSCLDHQLFPIELNLQEYKNDLNSKELIPIKLMSSWSKNLSIFYIIAADITYCNSQNKSVIIKSLQSLSQKWEDQQIFPIADKNIIKYMQIKGMRQCNLEQ
ncbi:hypothetical protein ABPG72_016046 [Tetrahymena utriculariae]